jgi:DNA repair protein RecN (Recombination protein N)
VIVERWSPLDVKETLPQLVWFCIYRLIYCFYLDNITKQLEPNVFYKLSVGVMLTYLNISNFAIVEALSVDWKPGMSTITGETGAGKSIAIDALAFCLGERSDAGNVRADKDKAEVDATFDIRTLPMAQSWLLKNDLNNDDDCILRRSVNASGRSRAFINGKSVTLAQLKSLGQHLIAIHGQHAHQLLAKSDYQRRLLDGYANHPHLLSAVAESFKGWRRLTKQRDELLALKAQGDASRQLLEYQVQELDEFDLQSGEFEEIEQQHKRLNSGDELSMTCASVLEQLYDNDDHSVSQLLQSAAKKVEDLAMVDGSLTSVSDMLAEAVVQVEEATSELRQYSDRIEIDPKLLHELDERLSMAINLSRKHSIEPNAIPDRHSQLAEELKKLASNIELLETIDADVDRLLSVYKSDCKALTKSRKKHGKTLAQAITDSMKTLNMPDGLLSINIDTAQESLGELGADEVHFNVTTNPGQPLQPLGKVASGGELSRISLSIQVIVAQQETTPTLIFDEVDVGISGGTATIVGKLLRQLGETTQVISITHLPQVASQGHQQFRVNKYVKNKQTSTSMQPLTKTERIEEIARLVGGENISTHSRANAQELLAAIV